MKAKASALRIKRIFARARSAVGSVNGWKAWAMVFDLDPTDKASVLKRLAELYEELDKLSVEFRLSESKEYRSSQLPFNLKEFITCSDLNARWKTAVQSLDRLDLIDLDRYTRIS